jgi:caspase domain-containing protein/PAN domain-containing protein
MRWFLTLVLCITAWSLADADALADTRVALVIGNGAYVHVPHLPNPSHDAEDVAAALKRTGFDVILGTDLDQAGMQDAAIRFARAARSADVAVFYYSGHAMQYAGVNYLIPVDAQLRDEPDLRRMARVDEILADLQQAKNLRILVLDSCRDNPLADQLKRSLGSTRSASIGRGLAKMESPDGTIISYSTQSGRTAEDGNDRNSPYTTVFLQHIEDKDDIATVFHRIGAGVYQTTQGKQVPELSLSFFGEFYLNGPVSVSINPPAQSPAIDPCTAAETHWKSADAVGTLAAYQDHLSRFPNCAFADLSKAHIESLKNKVAIVAPPVPPAVPNMLNDVNLFGQDFAGFPLESADPKLCQTACQSDTKCVAWSYVRPGVQGRQARCWLKDHVPPQTASNCCVSGIEGAHPSGSRAMPRMFAEVDLSGQDYAGFPLGSADPALCQNACQSDTKCLAWTYVRPGVQGKQARCWLKNPVPAGHFSTCCVSGIEGTRP